MDGRVRGYGLGNLEFLRSGVNANAGRVLRHLLLCCFANLKERVPAFLFGTGCFSAPLGILIMDARREINLERKLIA